MSTVPRENKIAVLLTSLPRSAADGVLTRFSPERSNRLRGLMERVRAGLSPDLIDEVLREFEELLSRAARDLAATHPRLALDTVPDADTYVPGGAAGVSSARNGDDEKTTPVGAGDDSNPAQYAPAVDDFVAELRLIDTSRLAAALQDEHPRGIATVLSCLEPAKACEALLILSPEIRKNVFTRLGQTTGGTDDVSLRIIRAVVLKSRAAAADPTQTGGDEKAQMMADMLKSMEREDRSELMNALVVQDEAMAAAVRERLYVFDDLANIEGPSMQKLLAQIDSKTLGIALQDAQENIIDNVMVNLSKRARESLTEEMSFLGTISPTQVQQARKAVVEVIQLMDQAEGSG